MSVGFEDLLLLDAVRELTLRHPHPAIEGFKPAMRDWGDRWVARAPRYLPAADLLDDARQRPDCAAIVDLFARQRERLCWEQSYTRTQRLVPDAMLAGYAFTEIIGKRGPFVSERIRAGIGIWDAGIEYPRHRHQAEEIYLPLAGSAQFTVGTAAPARRAAGEVVYVAADTPHGFTTEDELLVVFYLWQAGDLRQISSFG